MAKTDKLASALATLATGADLERVEVQLVTVRDLLKEGAARAEEGAGGQELSKAKIVSNQSQMFGGKVITRVDPKPSGKS
jgi:hypothetical protein